jgi:hypothetical protein
MKTIINLTILLAAAAGISASPAPAEQINDVITAGGNTYTGLSTVSLSLAFVDLLV